VLANNEIKKNLIPLFTCQFTTLRVSAIPNCWSIQIVLSGFPKFQPGVWFLVW